MPLKDDDDFVNIPPPNELLKNSSTSSSGDHPAPASYTQHQANHYTHVQSNKLTTFPATAEPTHYSSGEMTLKKVNLLQMIDDTSKSNNVTVNAAGDASELSAQSSASPQLTKRSLQDTNSGHSSASTLLRNAPNVGQGNETTTASEPASMTTSGRTVIEKSRQSSYEKIDIPANAAESLANMTASDMFVKKSVPVVNNVARQPEE